MSAVLSSLGPGHIWRAIATESDAVAVAERDALGTTARVAFWPAARHGLVVGAVDRVLTELNLQASRFRSDSEISAMPAAGGRFTVSAGLAEAISIALAAARWTGGLVDPTVGGPLCALGYDRDFVLIGNEPSGSEDGPAPAGVPGWRAVRLTGRQLDLAAGVQLDLGATGKGLGADRAATAACAAARLGGVLVSLGGDMKVAGQPPAGGWPVLVADDHRCNGTGGPDKPVQLVLISTGALATSSISCRQWQHGGQSMHHILDPRTGRPAAGPWRTVSVAAASCAEANAAATAAIVSGHGAEDWLAGTGLPARLVAANGTVQKINGWPAADGGVLPPVDAVMPRLPDSIRAQPGREGSSS
jgi:thiamine biosynthesis lipoprotein